MPPTGRHHLVAHLPPAGAWRRALHLDRAGGAPHPVILALAPAELADDPARLAALARDAEAAARVRHPNLVPSLGLETVGDALALASEAPDGVTLEALLEAGGRLPPDVAARVVADAAAGVAALHAVDAGDGHPLTHGALSPAWLSIGSDGVTRVSGAAAGAGAGGPAADVRALAAILHLCLSGEPSAEPPRPLDGPGVPGALAAVVDAALGAVPVDAGAKSAAAFGEAIGGALPLAPHEHVAAYLEAILPSDGAGRMALARRLAEARAELTAGDEAARASDADELIVEEETAPPWAVATTSSPDPNASPTPVPASPGPGSADPGPKATPIPRPNPTATNPSLNPTALVAGTGSGPAATGHGTRVTGTGTGTGTERPGTFPGTGTGTKAAPMGSGADAAITFPVPAAAAPRSRLPLLVGLLAAALGFGAGVVLSRHLPALATLGRAPQPPDASAPVGLEAAPAERAAAPDRPPAPAPAPQPAAPAQPSPAAPARQPAAPSPAPPRRADPPSLAISAEPAVDVFVDGKRVGRPPITVPVAAGDHEVRLRDAAQGVDTKRRVTARGPATPVRFALGRGVLSVTAPPDTEVIVDGRRAGSGNVRVELWEGVHRVEARRGEAKVGERFTLHPGETWTYDVTPTP
ncbi:PEGA domain-containing protein [Anaeromyxobacter oryzae]|uniref:PEGA domain-containing protein n=1 Tax=Anaeromyxobacter oryzae TaxID=2918170 RepID=A0ABM7X2V2_9BACT|nr:PEGA domain-containing protein [Anaeromyxobacter oryzae]BDG06114.1 hypothetical protein AMOR_51100 [Anaeromyxobacter oryzae]